MSAEVNDVPEIQPCAHFNTVIAAIVAEENVYKKPPTLQSSAEQNAPKEIIQTAVEIGLFSRQQPCGIHAQLARHVDGQKTYHFSCNRALSLATSPMDQSTVETLAREVVASDHHDLVLQRIVDSTLDLTPSLQTETDRWIQSRICDAPIREIDRHANGIVHYYCFAWQPAPIGEIHDTPESSLWYSARFQEIQRMVVEGDISCCCCCWH